MNDLKKTGFLPLVPVLAGGAALLLRKNLYALALDQRGLLVSGHPLSYALWAVVLLGAGFIFWNVRKLGGSDAYEDNFATSRVAFAGCILLAVGLPVTVLNVTPSGTGTVALLWKILGFLSAPAVAWAGVSRYQGKKPFFGTHAVLCLFLLMHMVSRYQVWSSNPQLQDYIFELLASLVLTLFSYYCAAFEADMGSRRMQLTTGLLAVLLCPPALFGSEYRWLYLLGAVWALTNLCASTLPPKEVAADEIA